MNWADALTKDNLDHLNKFIFESCWIINAPRRALHGGVGIYSSNKFRGPDPLTETDTVAILRNELIKIGERDVTKLIPKKLIFINW